MPTTKALFIERHTLYADIEKDADAAKLLAEKYNLTPHGVRGRLSSGNTIENRLLLSTYLRDNYTPDKSIKKQKSIIDDSTVIFKELQQTNKPEFIGVFISDKHNPDYREDAWELVCTILDDMPDVDYITVQNDWNHNEGYGRWEDTRRPKDKIWSSDAVNMREMEKNDYNTLKIVQPNSTLLALLGNHDKWWYNNQRTNNPQDAENNIAVYMEWLYNEFGILQFTRGLHENSIRLSPGLVWAHGKWASQSPIANAKKAVKQFTMSGVASSIVIGHTHRPSTVEGHSIGLPGIRIINNGCLCHNNVEYLAYGKTNTWGLGMTVCYFHPTTRHTELIEIRFNPVGNNLVGRFNGKKYTVKLKE